MLSDDWYSMVSIGTSWSVSAFSMKDDIGSGSVTMAVQGLLGNLCTHLGSILIPSILWIGTVAFIWAVF